MSARNIATAGILLSSLALAGCVCSAPSAASGPEWMPIGNRKARVVLWGVTHNHAKGKFDALKRLPDYYEIVGVVDNSASKVMRMAEPKMKNYEDYPKFTPEQVINEVKPDLVVIEVSNQELVDVAKMCADAGIPMHMDKPLGVTKDGFKYVSDVCRARNIPLQTGYMFRVNGAIQFACKAAHDGVIGDVFSIDADLNHSYGGKKYPEYCGTYPAGTAYLLTCHVIEYVLPLMDEVAPDFVKTWVMPAPGDPEGTPSHTFTLMTWPRTTCTITVCSKGTQSRRHLRIDGSDGTIEITPIEDFRKVKHDTGEEGGEGNKAKAVDPRIMVKMYLKKDKGEYKKGETVLDFGIIKDRYADQLKELAEILRGEKPNPQWLYDHDLLVHDVSLRACNL